MCPKRVCHKRWRKGRHGNAALNRSSHQRPLPTGARWLGAIRTLPPCRRVTHVMTAVCPSAHPPFSQIPPFPPAPLNTCSPMKPLSSHALRVAERLRMGSARCRAGIQGAETPPCRSETKVPPPPHPLGAGDCKSVSEPLENDRAGRGLVPFLPYQLRSLCKQVIFAPTHPTDSSGLDAQAVPSPSCINNNNTGPVRAKLVS